MNNKVFGEVRFNSGWETTIVIFYNEKKYEIVVTADAYFEKDCITEQQEASYIEFLDNREEILSKIKKILNRSKYVPVLMLIKRNGDYGLVFDDEEDIEGGIVVTVKPKMEILSTDQYL